MSVCILVLCLLAVPYGSYGGVTNVELSKIMQTLWNSDTNRLVIDRDIRINLQSKTSLYSSTDLAPSRFFVQVPNLEKKPTFKKFIALLDNYIGQIDKPDRASGSELAEQQTLMNSILGTQVWHRARTFLVNGGFISSFSHLASELDRIWFTEYSRTKGIVGSSGFEHVFVGELADDKGEISGLHNWITVYKLEQAGKVNYKGYLKTQTVNNLYELKLQQGSYTKKGSTMFIGTSPEFEMAVYTICFLARSNQKCDFTLNGQTVSIQTYSSYNTGLGTAYPRI